MVAPRQAMESVARAIADSGELPADISLLLHEADEDNDDADVDLPLLEIQPDGIDDIVLHNDDLTGYIVDDSGNRTGRLYESEYEMTLQLDLWTTKDDGYDVDDLANRLRSALYQHSSYGPQKSFRDENAEPLDEIHYFRLVEGDRVDDLISTPTTRVWSQTVELWAYETFDTTEEYITAVDYPDA